MGAMQGVWNQKLKIEIKIKINSEDGTHAGWVDSGEEEVDWYWSRYKQQVFLSDPAIPGVRSMGPSVSNWLTEGGFWNLYKLYKL